MDRCVVGNCNQPDQQVKRCYWTRDVAIMRGTVEDHAYLDLCSFHQSFMNPHTCSAWIQGWSALEEPEEPEPVCSCPRFSDTGGYRIADLACAVHGINGSDPGDGYWEEEEE